MAQKGQKMAVTIKDVAKQAGVSTATVSKVMNGSYSISQETIDRVKKVIRTSGREILSRSPRRPLSL